MFDLIIRNGTVHDGTGAAPKRLDVGVRGGRIASVAPDLGGVEATEVVDATGRIVTPGFVDIHTHFDGQVTWDDLLEPSSGHGVTTVVTGNCGVGFAPVHPEAQQALIELMEGVEDIPGAALSEGLTWGWETYAEYLDVLDTKRWSMDVATQLAHGPLRTYVMGPSAAERLAATGDQIAAMERLVREAVEAGAFGVSTSRTLGHRALDGTPVPGTYAAYDELAAIARGVTTGKGRIMEFAESGLARSDDAATVDAEFDWIGRLAGELGLSASFIVLQVQDHPDRWRRQMQLAAAWRAKGVHVTPLVAGRPFGVIYTWDVRHPFAARPSYRAIAALPLPERLAQLRRSDVRAAILGESDVPLEQAAQNAQRYLMRILAHCFALSGVPDYEQPRDHTLGVRAEREGLTVEEVAYDALVATDDAALLYPLFNYADFDHEALYEQLCDPDAVLGLNDGGAHCAYVCDASMPSYVLTHWVRDRQRGTRLPLPEAIRRLTSQPADLYGFADRGRIAEGLRADLNVIDAEHLTLAMPRPVADLPAGGVRLLQPATGYDLTTVAGVVTRRSGADTGARPGRLLRNG